jgi:hypothetical protein
MEFVSSRSPLQARGGRSLRLSGIPDFIVRAWMCRYAGFLPICRPRLWLIFAIAPCLFGQHWPATFLSFRVASSGGDGGPADIQLMRSRVIMTAPATYFEITGWNAGMPAGGYLGIQDATTGGGTRCSNISTGRNYIFSLWDSPSGSPQAFVVYSNPSGSACHGTGEGGAAGYLNYLMPWQLGAWYQFVARAWNYNSNSYFGFWSLDENAAVWTHHATLGYPAPNIVMNGGEGAFLEYFGSTSDPAEIALRRAEFNGNWIRALSKVWVPLQYAQFTVHGQRC